jgi:hypothetical protein
MLSDEQMSNRVTDEENRLRNKWFEESGEKAYTGFISDGDDVIFKNDYVKWLEKKAMRQEVLDDVNVIFPANSLLYKMDFPISEEIYLVLCEMDVETCGKVAKYLNTINPALTVCPRCHVDDFVHTENCNFL